MTAMPQEWFMSTPGVSETGPFNPHFVIDIGLVNLVSGGLVLTGSLRKNGSFIVIGSIWPLLHALFHVLHWSVEGLPSGVALALETIFVVMPAFVGILCGFVISRKMSDAVPSSQVWP
ncbi:hypothetical protein DC522_14405 [Microvirga sp. KLBC 81]|uniref:hypothetical protein n=1 Tax=Microvirga sp. KLBC 81 TaxID=1862707 RepID=UPI000D519ECA|nr:hypothetical protein [Microvirga sp. KLBC 81]PVE23640.1 hypothetical protein DC522_14405 [Microvirga sp. KLBC 81]